MHCTPSPGINNTHALWLFFNMSTLRVNTVWLASCEWASSVNHYVAIETIVSQRRMRWQLSTSMSVFSRTWTDFPHTLNTDKIFDISCHRGRKPYNNSMSVRQKGEWNSLIMTWNHRFEICSEMLWLISCALPYYTLVIAYLNSSSCVTFLYTVISCYNGDMTRKIMTQYFQTQG